MFLAQMSGSSWHTGPEEEFPTITEARRWAEAFGTTADECAIVDLTSWEPRATHPRARRPIVAVHRRDTSGDGQRWFKATPPRRMIDDGAVIDADPQPRRWS